MGQMNPIMMYALMKDDTSKNSDLALMMMMMNMQGQGGSDMSAMLPILLLSRDDDKPKTTTAPTLAPKIQTMVKELDQKNNLIKLIDELGLTDLAPIPTEWNLPNEPYSPETIDKIKETMESNPDMSNADALALIKNQEAVDTLDDLAAQSATLNQPESGQIPSFPSDTGSKESEINPGFTGPEVTKTVADEGVTNDAFALLQSMSGK
jgi:hypothetical protein